MNNTVTRWILAVALLAPAARAKEEGEGAPPAVVEGRLFPIDGTHELSISLGISINNKLNEHIGIVVNYAYNLNEWLALEGVAAISPGKCDAANPSSCNTAFGKRSNLAKDVITGALGRWADDIKSDEFSDNAILRYSGQAGIRFEPIYGKLSLASELALHFRAWGSLGAGVAIVEDRSLVYCEEFAAGKCNAYRDRGTAGLVEGELGATRLAFNAGLGIRFFFAPWFSFRIEMRDFMFQDSLLKEINPKQVKANNRSGKPEAAPGLTHVAYFTFGAAFLF